MIIFAAVSILVGYVVGGTLEFCGALNPQLDTVIGALVALIVFVCLMACHDGDIAVDED